MAGALAGKVALITGAGSGIGRATALLFAREGAGVVVVDIDDDSATETVSLIQQSGGSGLFVHADVAKSADSQHMIEAAVRHFGRLDILHNNAFWTVYRPVVETSEYEWDRTMAVCLKAAFLAAKYAIPHMLRTGGGAIINTSSVSGIRGQSAHTAYESAKGGLLALTRSLAADCAPRIRVNAILPGGVMTPALQLLDAELIRQNTNKIPLKRRASPEEIANAVLFLAGDASSFCTGACLVVDGGRSSILL